MLRKFIQVEIGTRKIGGRKKKKLSNHRKTSCIYRTLEQYMTRNILGERNTTHPSAEVLVMAGEKTRPNGHFFLLRLNIKS